VLLPCQVHKTPSSLSGSFLSLTLQHVLATTVYWEVFSHSCQIEFVAVANVSLRLGRTI
jgi:hypothetical protein